VVQEAGGSSPLIHPRSRSCGRSCTVPRLAHAPLAQLAEHPALNRQVRGSSPWRRTSRRPALMAGFLLLQGSWSTGSIESSESNSASSLALLVPARPGKGESQLRPRGSVPPPRSPGHEPGQGGSASFRRIPNCASDQHECRFPSHCVPRRSGGSQDSWSPLGGHHRPGSAQTERGGQALTASNAHFSEATMISMRRGTRSAATSATALPLVALTDLDAQVGIATAASSRH
jgi:hypothetical protein